ncbi:hypothetical protein TNCT_393151 [Trichonephila clavata]|uniref:Uncharacterized protein n=1 Tax=Trichonephila clavata TaxID=2740835 RepID=A0A8X6F3Y2_TRICU|nr:hypothetical protein TNCT_393151 [Trichonephila clavata]
MVRLKPLRRNATNERNSIYICVGQLIDRENKSHSYTIDDCKTLNLATSYGSEKITIKLLKNRKNVSRSKESRFQLYHEDGCVRVLRKSHEAMGLICQMNTIPTCSF